MQYNDYASQELEAEFENEFESDYDDEFEFEFEYGDDYEFEFDGPFGESEEMELAAELLAVGSDQELDEFIGKLVRRAGRGVKRFARSKAGRAVGSFAKRMAKRALPVVGKAAGGFFGGPAGAAIGGKLGGLASRMFEMELEGLSPEDQEFEVAKRIVRFTGEAAKNAAKIPPSKMTKTNAKKAITKAAKKHAPGLLKGRSGGKRMGKWMRRGNRIILFGA